MAVAKIGSYAPGDENLNDLMTSANLQAIGNDKVTANTSTDVMNSGSVFECGGSYYQLTSNVSISGSKTNPVHVYFNPTTEAFSYSTTVPTYNNTLQGYYSSTNKCLLRGDTTGVHQLKKPETMTMTTGAEINMSTGSEINLATGSDINIATGADINIATGGGIEVASGGEINIASGAEINIASGADIVVDGGEILNSGAITTESGGFLSVLSGGSFTCASGSSASFSGTCKLPSGTSSPTPIGSGTAYINTSDNYFYFYNGSAWRKIASSAV